jgi:hypothetical protein
LSHDFPDQPTNPLIRDTDAPRNLEVFLVSAIVTIVITRVYLQLAGYPQVGGATLHIAHMLWGGLLMLAGLILFISYLNFSVRLSASLISGIGFGLFIDELGKFITTDNNYFFQPTFALLYVLFVGLFLIVRSMFWVVPLSEHEQAVNRDVRRNPSLTSARRSPLVAGYLEVTERVRGGYRRVVGEKWFRVLLVVSFVTIGLGHGIAAVTSFVTQGRSAGPVDNLYLASTLISGLLILAGIIRLWFSRRQALRLFRTGILVSLSVTQIFLFYANELAALGGLTVDLITYAALNTMIRLEGAGQDD